MRLYYALVTWCGLWWAAFFFIIKIIFSFLIVAWRLNILHVTRCLLKSWVTIFLSPWAPNLFLITIFLSRICTLNAILMPFNCSSTVVAENLDFFKDVWLTEEDFYIILFSLLNYYANLKFSLILPPTLTIEGKINGIILLWS